MSTFDRNEDTADALGGASDASVQTAADGVPGTDDPTRTRAPHANDATVAPASSGTARLPAPLHFRDPDRYQIVGEHGRGGLGRVMRARDKELGRDVAVKELLQRTTTSELRFFREALITARLEHPSIVPVHEAGRWPDGTPFYAMKLVQGRPMRELIDECKTMADRLALLPHVIAVVDAIAYAHDRKIIHRDLKPSNVIVGAFGETVVIDWGLAKDLTAQIADPIDDGPYRSPAEQGLTQAGSVLGTPAYMAPEQREGRADERSDIYAIGGILCHLAGVSPLRRPEVPTPVTPREFPRETPRDLIAIVSRAMAPSVTERYQTASALAVDLRRFTQREPVSARRYSIAARAALSFARYRTAALILIGALIALAMTLAVAVLKVNRQREQAIEARDDAETQRKSAEQERDKARLAEASVQLDSDPTAAVGLLSKASIGPKEALVLAWARAQGVADRVISVPGQRVRLAIPDEEGRAFAVASSDRSLYIVDVDSGEVHQAADSLLEPPAVVRVAGVWHYLRADGRGYSIASTQKSDPTWNIPELQSAPKLVPGTGAAILDGTLFEAENGSHEPVINGVRAVVRRGDTWIVCNENNDLYAIDRDGHEEQLGKCAQTISDATFMADTNGFVAEDRDAVVIGDQTSTRRVAVRAGEVAQFALAANGLVAGISDDGQTWFVRHKGPSQEPGHTRPFSLPTAVAADGSFVAWGYAEGVIDVLNIDTGETWELKGTHAAVYALFIDGGRRTVISVAGSELRKWALGAPLGLPNASIPCQSFNLSLRHVDGKTLIANDCADGSVVVSEAQNDRIEHTRIVHKHATVAFGVAWATDSEICSSGWDSAVLCTNINTGSSTVVTRLTHPVRWIASDGHGRLAFVSADGALWSGDVHSVNQSFEFKAEPYRVAFSEDGGAVAACAYDGTVVVTNGSGTHTLFAQRAHLGLVTSLRWQQAGQLLSAGVDGTIIQHAMDGSFREVAHFDGEVRHLAESHGTLAASINGTSLWIRGPSGEFQIKVETEVISVDVDPSGDMVAATTATGELLVFRGIRASKPSVAVKFLSRARVSAVTFLDSAVVAAANYDIFAIPISSFSFVDFTAW